MPALISLLESPTYREEEGMKVRGPWIRFEATDQFVVEERELDAVNLVAVDASRTSASLTFADVTTIDRLMRGLIAARDRLIAGAGMAVYGGES